MLLNICSQSVQLKAFMDFSANPIDSQLDQLIPTLCDITDYWSVNASSQLGHWF